MLYGRIFDGCGGGGVPDGVAKPASLVKNGKSPTAVAGEKTPAGGEDCLAAAVANRRRYLIRNLNHARATGCSVDPGIRVRDQHTFEKISGSE